MRETGFVFHISMPRFWKDGLWCRWPVAQRRVRPLRVVFQPPSLRQNLCLLQRVQDLAVQELIAQLPIETLTIPVLPRTPRLDIQRLRAQSSQPLSQLLGNELRPVVRTYVLRYPAHQHHVCQGFDHLQTSQAPCHSQRQTFPRMLVDHHQDAQRSSIVRHRLHKIVAPHMIRPLRSQSDTPTIPEPQPPSWPLFLRHLQPFASPDPLHSILPHRPAHALQLRRDTPVAVSPVLHCQGQDRLCQLIFVPAPQRQIALCPSPLPYYPACPPLAHLILLAGLLHRAPTSLRAYKFPSAISFRICLSRASSATSRFNLPFSFSRFFHPLRLVHLQAAVFLPPAVEGLDCDLGFFASLWGGLSVRDADFNLP